MLATMISSHTDDSVADATLVVARCRCRVMPATMLSIHAGDDVAEVTWPRRDVDAESC
jgi:hypothetical protein